MLSHLVNSHRNDVRNSKQNNESRAKTKAYGRDLGVGAREKFLNISTQRTKNGVAS